MKKQPQNKTLYPPEPVKSDRIDYSNPNDTHVQIYQRINILVLAIALAVCLAVGLTVWSALRQDEITRTENLTLATAAIATDRATMAHTLTDYAVGDDIYENIVLSPNTTWWFNNFRRELFEEFGVSIAAIYNARDQISMLQRFGDQSKFGSKSLTSAEIREFLNFGVCAVWQPECRQNGVRQYRRLDLYDCRKSRSANRRRAQTRF